MDEIKKIVQTIEGEIIALRRQIHGHPELSHNENETASCVASRLEKEGYKITRGVAKTGFIAQIGESGKALAIRCDMDALPITEETGAAYESQNVGVMHACGHDAHTAIVTGVAIVLKNLSSRLNGRVKFIFQPAEEAHFGGADLVVKEGWINDVSAMVGLHVDPTIEAGKFGVKNGAMMASVDFFDITIFGKGGHGARPQDTIDPIAIAASCIQELYSIIGKSFSTLESPVVISVGKIQGGEAPNVIPETCSFSGTFRTFDESDRKKLRERVQTIVQGICHIQGATCSVEITANAPPVINDEKLGGFIENCIVKNFGEASLMRLKFPMTASEDFAYYREKCPIYFLRLGVSKDVRTSYGLHHPKFDIDEAVLARAVELLSYAALTFFDEFTLPDQ